MKSGRDAVPEGRAVFPVPGREAAGVDKFLPDVEHGGAEWCPPKPTRPARALHVPLLILRVFSRLNAKYRRSRRPLRPNYERAVQAPERPPQEGEDDKRV